MKTDAEKEWKQMMKEISYAINKYIEELKRIEERFKSYTKVQQKHLSITEKKDRKVYKE